MKLIIAEKPSLAKTIATAIEQNYKKFNGYFEAGEYVVTFAFGHLFGLYEVDDYLGVKTKWSEAPIPFMPEKFKFKLKDDEGVRNQFEIIKNLIAEERITEIINCGDADREGQIIIDIILQNIGVAKPTKRLWLPEQTDNTIIEQLNNLEENTKFINLHNEGLARTYIDWLYGINLTRYVTNKVGQMLPCGRVLIPIVKYIYDRDIAIANFKEEKYYMLESQIKDTESLLTIRDIKYKSDELEQAQIKAGEINLNQAYVTKFETKEKEKLSPKLFSLSKLQSKLSSDYKMSFEKSMNIIQSLYEKALITYPRTNTEYLAENEVEKVEKLIEKYSTDDMKLELKNTKRIFDNSKIESHSAIIPTLKHLTDLSDDEKIVYNTVFNRFISVFLSEKCIVAETKIIIQVADYEFELKGETIISQGYLKVEPEKIENLLPTLYEGETFNVDFKPVEKKTTKPKKVTESDLSQYLKNPYRSEIKEAKESDNIDDTEEYIAILKGLEIGTEATRTGIISNAVKYNYIILDKGNFETTDLGKKFIETLDKLEIDLYKDKTVKTSELQKQIYNGEIAINDIVDFVNTDLMATVSKNIEVARIENKSDKEIIGKCVFCGGDVYEGVKNYYCENYGKDKPCKMSIYKDNIYFEKIGKKLTKANVVSLLKGKGLKGIKYTDLVSNKTGKTYNAEVVIDKDITDKVNFKMIFTVDSKKK